MLVHGYSENIEVSLNAVLGSYECEHYCAEYYFFHIVQVFSKIRNVFIFIEWGTFWHSIRGTFSQRICPIRSNLVEFVHAFVSLAPRRSRTTGGYHHLA